MLRVRLSGGRIHVGARLSVSFQRTLRVPSEGEFPLPPGLGAFPIVRVRTAPVRLPPRWRSAPQFAVPLHQHEALWLGFNAADWKPNAIKVSAGGVNAVSGGVWEPGLHRNPQDYIVVPDQPWLDGFNAGDEHIRQFVASPLGEGITAEEQLMRGVPVGGIQLEIYEAKPGRFPTRPRKAHPDVDVARLPPMGLAPGGRIRQKVYADPYGFDVWDRRRSTQVVIHLFNVEQFRAETGHDAPPSPISAETYAQYGLPWFDVYDEHMIAVSGSRVLSRLKGAPLAPSDRESRPLDPPALPVHRLRLNAPTRSRSRSEKRKDRSHG